VSPSPGPDQDRTTFVNVQYTSLRNATHVPQSMKYGDNGDSDSGNDTDGGTATSTIPVSKRRRTGGVLSPGAPPRGPPEMQASANFVAPAVHAPRVAGRSRAATPMPPQNAAVAPPMPPPNAAVAPPMPPQNAAAAVAPAHHDDPVVSGGKITSIFDAPPDIYG
jgi:hypothetical protein